MITLSLIPAILGHFYLKGKRKLLTFIISLISGGIAIYLAHLLNSSIVDLALLLELCVIATLLATLWVKNGNQTI